MRIYGSLMCSCNEWKWIVRRVSIVKSILKDTIRSIQGCTRDACQPALANSSQTTQVSAMATMQ